MPVPTDVQLPVIERQSILIVLVWEEPHLGQIGGLMVLSGCALTARITGVAMDSILEAASSADLSGFWKPHSEHVLLCMRERTPHIGQTSTGPSLLCQSRQY
jgi:hypothetical protein